jgi:hypothetical protein
MPNDCTACGLVQWGERFKLYHYQSFGSGPHSEKRTSGAIQESTSDKRI